MGFILFQMDLPISLASLGFGSLHDLSIKPPPMAINIAGMIYDKRMGVVLKSDILISDALHTRADILTSFSVIITLIGIKFGFPILDAIATLVISGFIAHAAVDILKESSRVLSDGVAIPIEEIKRIVLSIRGVEECHQIRSRGRGDDIQ